jgi:hypothetical protein
VKLDAAVSVVVVPVVVAVLLVRNAPTGSEPSGAEPVCVASRTLLAALLGEESMPVLEEPPGWVDALPPVLVVAALPLLRCLLVVPVVEFDAVPAAPVEAPEPPAEPVEPLLWVLSALVCGDVPDGAVSA